MNMEGRRKHEAHRVLVFLRDILVQEKKQPSVSQNKFGWTAARALMVQSAAESEKEPLWHWAVCLARSFVSPLKTELMDSAPKHFKTPPQCKPVNS